MKEFKDTLAGFVLFFLTTIINVTVAIIIFYFVQHKSTWMIAISIIALVIVMSLFMTIFDYFRRKTMITKPLKEILDATESCRETKILEIKCLLEDYENRYLKKGN